MTLPARQAFVAYRLRGRGYPLVLALRVALTPPLAIAAPVGDPDARPGRDLAEDIARRLPDVVEALLYWERWAP